MATNPPKRSKAVALSNVLFALVLVAAGVVAYLYFVDDSFFKEGPPPPACPKGHNELICVVNALKATELKDVDLGRYTATASQLEQPGQVIEIGNINAFLFIYPSNSSTMDEAIKAREADAADLDPATITITSRISDRPLNDGQDIHVFQHSNVILLLVGGTDHDIEQVQKAIDSLP